MFTEEGVTDGILGLQTSVKYGWLSNSALVSRRHTVMRSLLGELDQMAHVESVESSVFDLQFICGRMRIVLKLTKNADARSLLHASLDTILLCMMTIDAYNHAHV